MKPEQMVAVHEVVSINPAVMSGTPCFAGTRVPVQTLLDYLEDGDTIDDFLTDFVTVTRTQAVQFLELAKDRLIECVSSSNRREGNAHDVEIVDYHRG